MDHADVWGAEGGRGASFLLEPGNAKGIVGEVGGQELQGDFGSSRSSLASQTSPIPPAPISEGPSYGPSFDPGVRATTCSGGFYSNVRKLMRA